MDEVKMIIEEVVALIVFIDFQVFPKEYYLKIDH